MEQLPPLSWCLSSQLQSLHQSWFIETHLHHHILLQSVRYKWESSNSSQSNTCHISCMEYSSQSAQTEHWDLSEAESCRGGRCRSWSHVTDHGKNSAEQTNGKNYQFICHHETGSWTISNQMKWNEFGKIDFECRVEQGWKPLYMMMMMMMMKANGNDAMMHTSEQH